MQIKKKMQNIEDFKNLRGGIDNNIKKTALK